jgi:hypothetical protein
VLKLPEIWADSLHPASGRVNMRRAVSNSAIFLHGQDVVTLILRYLEIAKKRLSTTKFQNFNLACKLNTVFWDFEFSRARSWVFQESLDRNVLMFRQKWLLTSSGYNKHRSLPHIAKASEQIYHKKWIAVKTKSFNCFSAYKIMIKTTRPQFRTGFLNTQTAIH